MKLLNLSTFRETNVVAVPNSRFPPKEKKGQKDETGARDRDESIHDYKVCAFIILHCNHQIILFLRTHSSNHDDDLFTCIVRRPDVVDFFASLSSSNCTRCYVARSVSLIVIIIRRRRRISLRHFRKYAL